MPINIPDKFKGFLVIARFDVPDESISVAFAINKALETIESYVRINKLYKIFVGTFPFKIPVPPDNGNFIFTPSDQPNDYVCAVYDNYIFVDYSQVLIYSPPVQVAHILEEFVHALMNVADEVFAKNIVCHLLRPHIDLDEQGRYVLIPCTPASQKNDKDKKKTLHNEHEN